MSEVRSLTYVWVAYNCRQIIWAGIFACVFIGLNGCSKVGQFDFINDSPEINNAPGVNIAKGVEIANIAKQYLGVSYVYGGHNPSGFDCSGLVLYSHQKVGIDVPRTAHLQYEAAREISASEMHQGDVVFFRLGLWKASHVGIYVGNGRFIHAPSSGKKVTLASLSNPYWRNRIVKIGRFYR